MVVQQEETSRKDYVFIITREWQKLLITLKNDYQSINHTRNYEYYYYY